MTATSLPSRRRRRRDTTPDSHRFSTRPYDLVKEFVIALVVMSLLSVALAAVFSSPDDKAITLARWAQGDPADVVATATAELAGTSTSATYGAPYNDNGPGQKLGPLALQKWFGVHTKVDSANDLVLTPLRDVRAGNVGLTVALARWDRASVDQRSRWSNAYADALAKAPDGDPAKVAAGSYGPVPALTAGYLVLARTGALEGLLTTSSTFYGGNSTKPLLLLADGAFLEDQARAQHLGGDQWGMTNEVGNFPGQPWMWLYTFWYQVKPFSTSENADALVWGLMAVLSLGFVLLPFIPGVRSIPRGLGVYKLIWRDWYAKHPRVAP